jgi:hypothetical protein
MVLAVEIRRFVCANYIKSARGRGETRIAIKAGDVHARMGFVGRMPAVCSALRSRELQRMCDVRLVEEIRRPGVKGDSSTNIFVFELVGVEPINKTVAQNTREPLFFIEKVDEKFSSRVFENLCMNKLGEYFKAYLSKGKVPNIPKEFDMVSPDGKIIGDAKYFTMVRGESILPRIPSAKFATIAEHVWLLEKSDAVHKFLCFGNDRRVPKEWLKRYGHLVENVTFFFLDEQTRLLEKLN